MSKRSIILVSILLIIYVIAFCLALMVGRYSISLAEFFKAVFSNDTAYKTQRSIILNLRLPRTLLATCVGIGLSLSGLLFQETFRNKLTSPDLLGVSTGASVGAAIAIILNISSAFISFFAFITGIGTVCLTIALAKLFKNNSSATLILAGIIVGGFMSSILSIIKFLADPTTTLATITYWLLGSFENATMNQVYILLPIVAICSIFLLVISWKINIVALGQEEAQTRGVNYNLYKYLLIGIATLLTAISVAYCGTISWVGLVIPHLVRLIAKRDTRNTIPLCITGGAVFMVVVDIFSRSLTDAEIPISAISGFIGTIIFVIILANKQKEVTND